MNAVVHSISLKWANNLFTQISKLKIRFTHIFLSSSFIFGVYCNCEQICHARQRESENREFGCSFLQTGKTQVIYLPLRENVEVLKIKGCILIVVSCCCNPLTFVAIFDLGDIPVIG